MLLSIVSVCVHVRVFIHVADGARECAGQRSTLSVTFRNTTHLLKSDLLLTRHSPVRQGWLASEHQGPSCLCLPRAGAISMCFRHRHVLSCDMTCLHGS